MRIIRSYENNSQDIHKPEFLKPKALSSDIKKCFMYHKYISTLKNIELGN